MTDQLINCFECEIDHIYAINLFIHFWFAEDSDEAVLSSSLVRE